MTFSQRLNQVITEMSNREEFSGVVLVKQEKTVLFEGAYGYASRPWKIKNRMSTRFCIASVSKMFTSDRRKL